MAYGRTAYESHNVSTDYALLDITVRLDTAKWSKRKKNIITKMITTGVLDAGMKTVFTTADIMRSHNIPWRSQRGWADKDVWDTQKVCIKSEKLSDLTAAIVAGIKIRAANRQVTTWTEDCFVRRTEGDQDFNDWVADIIPIRRGFPLEDYVHEDTPESIAAKEALCKKIVNGEVVTATYTPEQEAA